MQFFRIEGEPVNTQMAEDFDGKRTARSHCNYIRSKTRTFNKRVESEGFMCFCSLSSEHVVLCAIGCADDFVEKNLKKFLIYTGIALKDVSCSEILFDNLEGMMRTACREDLIEDEDEVMTRYGLDVMTRHYNEWDENLISDITHQEALEQAKRFLGSKNFTEEIERIYECGNPGKVQGHPVHYIVRTDDRDNRRELYRLLLSCLHENGRLRNRRYTFVDVDGDDSVGRLNLTPVYRAAGGGCVVIRYNPLVDMDGNMASAEHEVVEDLCRLIKKYRNQVLTILCFPRECSRVSAMFFENLSSMCFIDIAEDFAYDDAARAYLRMLAIKNKVRADKKLLDSVEENKGYLPTDLSALFDEWFDIKLRTKLYPQYKDAVKIKKQVQAEQPKGSAYDRLQEMVGLDSAKSVILQAIDYFKAQKLFKDKGMMVDRPAMHMIFTGNPGTAKTTVARLFAEIMRDNGLLSKGHMVECGRGDLVGRYVGWTAPTVQKKFRQAKGGVLFIDEAYSLVDDRDGLFGDEAINTIVQEMENHRDDVVVIFAGYPDKMEGFLKKNPGLRSRIAFHVNFDDYSAEELCNISRLLARDKNMVFDEDAIEKLSGIYELARTQEDFGNGRYARNLLDKARMKQASRLVKMNVEEISDSDIRTITADDIDVPELNKSTESHRIIGFCA